MLQAINHRAWMPFASLGLLLLAAGLGAVTISRAGESQRPRQGLHEPVHRTAAKARVEGRTDARPAQPTHPLDPALDMAREGLQLIRRDIQDYTATVVKRERIGGTLQDYEYMFAKIRNRKVANGRVVQPFSVYLYFLRPNNVRGREVIYVEGANGGRLKAHEGGLQGRFLPSVWLDPHGALAMRGQRYPITEIGIENLIVQLIERGERDRQHGTADVRFFENYRLNGRTCTMLRVVHPEPKPHLDFHIAEVFIDDELGIPIRYAAYSWPTGRDAEPPLIEEYNYLNIKLNVGLTDNDFDPNNSEYNF